MNFSVLRTLIAGAALGASTLFAAPAHALPSQLALGPAAPAGASFIALPGSARPISDLNTGAFNSAKMSVEVVLAPRNASQLSSLLVSLTNPKSKSYGKWLKKGQFNALFGPTAAQISAVRSYLAASGLVVGQSSSPFFVRASGSSSAVAAAFRTSLRTYRNAGGIAYFSNASAIQLPASLAANVLGVVGLSSTVRARPQYVVRPGAASAAAASPACDSPYPTALQLFNAINNGILFPYGYGGGPGCNGLTPSQDNATYGAPKLGPVAQGAGVNLAVFELSAYQQSDIKHWAQTFYGKGFTPPLVDINVDGGPLDETKCPAFDFCIYGYSGDVEVDADIETQLAISPAASHILVYNAPNDYTGQTELDEYSQIANDDIADVISSSWGVCENDESPLYLKTENLIFEQIAAQGQSIFASSGDTGAFGCIRTDGGTGVVQGDPSSQPWVTSVGGTSLESFNPGTNPNPVRPGGRESVWNVDNLCNDGPGEAGHTGFFYCAELGAGGGGSSQFWVQPYFQVGPGVVNAYSQKCALASAALQCREVPDVSANADPYTGYAEYCTNNANTPGGICGEFSSTSAPGWFAIGGTSLSSPLWSAIIADRDGFQGTRAGPATGLLYYLFNLNAGGYFHDITGIGQSTNNNGLFPTTPGYDLATGIGTPRMSAIITGVP